jgi:ribonuclease T2
LALISRRSSLALIAAITLATPTQAQLTQCAIPERLAEPERESPRAGEAINIRGSHHLLALSWSPQFCRGRRGDPREADQCDGKAGRFGFILHGLWPDLPGRNDPAWCAPAKPISRALIRRHFCMTPSPQLMQHEWAKHGSCMTDKPEKYFQAASLIFAALRFPDMDALSRQRLSVGRFRAEFAALNPGLRPNMIAVHLGGGNWLREVRICLNANLRPQPCLPEDRGAKPGRPMRIWRP